MGLRDDEQMREPADNLCNQVNDVSSGPDLPPATGGSDEIGADGVEGQSISMTTNDGGMSNTDALDLLDELEMPERFGPYTRVRKIGRGGMGFVFECSGTGEGWTKRVAIKVIRPRGIAEQLLRRFRFEKKALALCTHPAIVQILADGRAEDGRPYFVMEYLEGALPITEFCDERALSVKDRVELFRLVCAAVQHAHEKGVIHCDLKPGNVLVMPDGQPKIVDFGIAKIAKQEFEQYTAGTVTSPYMRLGTLDYSSPEQLDGRAVTLQSDVYSLGSMLYELIAGHTPYDFSRRTFFEILHMKSEVRPTPPSTASQRLKLLPAATRRDLDRIVLKAMQGEPQKRFTTVEEMSKSLAAALAPSHTTMKQLKALGYFLTGFVGTSRRRLVAAATGLFALTLILVTAGVVRWNRPVENTGKTSISETANSGPIFDSDAGKAEAAWVVFGSSLKHVESSVDPAVIELATFALCATGRVHYLKGLKSERYVSSRNDCTKENASSALHRLAHLANEGDINAATVLAYALYYEVEHGERSPEESFKWAKKSAEAQIPAGAYLLGHHYRWSVPTDRERAVQWYKRAADKDDIRAQGALCELLGAGADGAAEHVQRYVWCSLAASNPSSGDGAERQRSNAANERELQLKQLSPQQLVASKSLITSKLATLQKLGMR